MSSFRYLRPGVFNEVNFNRFVGSKEVNHSQYILFYDLLPHQEQVQSHHHGLFFLSAQPCALPPSLPFVIVHSHLPCYLQIVDFILFLRLIRTTETLVVTTSDSFDSHSQSQSLVCALIEQYKYCRTYSCIPQLVLVNLMIYCNLDLDSPQSSQTQTVGRTHLCSR